jgi:hypothetical protein
VFGVKKMEEIRKEDNKPRTKKAGQRRGKKRRQKYKLRRKGNRSEEIRTEEK